MLLVGKRQHLRRQNRSIVRAVNRHRRHRNAGGHLHGCKQCVKAVKRGRLHRNADDRQRRVRSQHARKMRSLARRRNDNSKAVLFRVLREFPPRPPACGVRSSRAPPPDAELLQSANRRETTGKSLSLPMITATFCSLKITDPFKFCGVKRKHREKKNRLCSKKHNLCF